MGFLDKFLGIRKKRATQPMADGFVYTCHQCQKSCTAAYRDSGTQSACRHCGVFLVVPPRIGLQLRWAEELAPTAYSVQGKAPGVFVEIPEDQLRQLFVGINVKRGKIDYMWLDGQEVRLDDTPVLKLDLSADSDRTGSLPTLVQRSLLGDKVLRYALLFLKSSDQRIYCAADDGEAHRMLPSFRTEQVLRAVISSVESGHVRWDQSQPIVEDDPSGAEAYQKRFEKHLDMYLKIPKIDRSVDYDQLLIFKPTFSGYYARYGVTAARVRTDEDFGLLMGSLPIAKAEEVMAHYSRESNKFFDLGKMPIGRAALIGWNFWSSGKLPSRTELYQGKRQIGLGDRPSELLKVDQMVHGSFNQLYVVRFQRDEFILWYALGGE